MFDYCIENLSEFFFLHKRTCVYYSKNRSLEKRQTMKIKKQLTWLRLECSTKTHEFCVYSVFTFCVTRCVRMKNKTSTKSRLLSLMINVVSLSRHVSRWFGNYFHWDLYTEIIYIATPLPECCCIPRENYSQIVTFLVEITSSNIPIVRRSTNNSVFRRFYRISTFHLRSFIITDVSRRHYRPAPQISLKKDSGNTGDKRTDAPRHYGHSNCNSIAEISIRCFSTRVHRTHNVRRINLLVFLSHNKRISSTDYKLSVYFKSPSSVAAVTET